MASSVFGNPITDSTLRGMPEYEHQTITRKDRAQVALNMKNAEGKDVHARMYVENLKKEWGDGFSIYNATGDTLTLVASNDWHGHIGPAPYPGVIANGQWGGYLHVNPLFRVAGSSAAVVYRGKNDAEDDCDWMLSWCNPLNRLYDNTVYTEIREANHYDDRNRLWDYIYDRLCNSGDNNNETSIGCVSMATTGSGTSPIFEGIMTLQFDA